jgi:uncharacterized protein YjbI with pentapeptide repeats
MANKEDFVELLKRGTISWNRWRAINPHIKPDFSGENLREIKLYPSFEEPPYTIAVVANLRELNFCGADFSKAHLAQIDLRDANLSNANFDGANLIGANLRGADLRGARFWNAHLGNADLSGANLSGASLCEADLIEANLSGANLSTAVLINAKLSRAELVGADLTEAKLRGARFKEVDFTGAKLIGANLTNTDVRQANLSHADLSGASLIETQAIGTNFNKATLTGSCIQHWNTNTDTNLNDVFCCYVYLQEGQLERLPIDRDFESGEFTKLFQSKRSYSRLSVLENLINRFESLLNDNPQGRENLFHEFLIKHPVLLDIYGEPDSKPKFYFPEEESPLGKKYVEPDVIIRYPGNKYKLVELEKPDKHWGTKQGQTTSELNQAAFQACSEWDYYINNHYELIKDKYPGISNYRSYMVVIGRKTQANVGGRNPEEYRQYIARQYSCEVCFYDDLLDKAKKAHAALVALSL